MRTNPDKYFLGLAFQLMDDLLNKRGCVGPPKWNLCCEKHANEMSNLRLDTRAKLVELNSHSIRLEDGHKCFPGGVEVVDDGNELVIQDKQDTGDYRWLRTVPDTDVADSCKRHITKQVASLMNTLGELDMMPEDAVKILTNHDLSKI